MFFTDFNAFEHVPMTVSMPLTNSRQLFTHRLVYLSIRVNFVDAMVKLVNVLKIAGQRKIAFFDRLIE